MIDLPMFWLVIVSLPVMKENNHKCSRVVRHSKYLFVWKGRIQFSHGVFGDDDLDLRTRLFQPGEFDAGASTRLFKSTWVH
ncbi:hypothetical protein PRUPE_1G102800 [Prunus persica]|uniref:Uncharacterized protein n=1 Tax=Prunus persica TaxID=3760 RepID=A0A251QV76_PRUPE|nr:hypothetical protein PRUPE_1G102800 [Prunus persica]